MLRERSERVERSGTYVTECVSRVHFCLALCYFGPPSNPVFWWLSPGGGGMPLLHAAGINCQGGATTENREAGIKYMG